MVEFDLSLFPKIGQWLFSFAKEIFESFSFNFGGYTLNGWIIILGVAVICIVAWFLGRIFQ